jgi:hypothetical protein
LTNDCLAGTRAGVPWTQPVAKLRLKRSIFAHTPIFI